MRGVTFVSDSTTKELCLLRGTHTMARTSTTANKRGYVVRSVKDARSIAAEHIQSINQDNDVLFGLPEVDDRYHVWRVPILSSQHERVGEIVISALNGIVDGGKSSSQESIIAKISTQSVSTNNGPNRRSKGTRAKETPLVASLGLRNAILQGDSEETLLQIPADSVGLVFTSPPYYNARPDYSEYVTYEEYLLKLRKITQQVHRVLGEGRFFVINVSPVLIRRASRGESSKRIAVPFDIHRILIEEGFDFVDDIHWVKPSGAGWATGRGRRFAADRTPLQYKAVPVTEYVLVYRKHTDKLIDWSIRNHPDQNAVERSKITGDYEATNIWKIHPAYSKLHPAIFPVELAERVIRYYSFEGDVVLDPFGGIGTTGEAAARLKRRFILSEMDPGYTDVIRNSTHKWLGPDACDVLCVGCAPIEPTGQLI